jgi:MFS family permease
MPKYKPAFAWLICALGATFYCYEYLIRILPSVIASNLMHAYSINAAELGKLAAIYYISYVPMQLPVGILADHYGPKKLLIMASVICAISCLLFAQDNLWLAHIGRFLAGFGSAFAFVCAMKLAALWLPQSRFALAVGLVMTLSMLGVVGGDIFLSKLVAIMGWPAVVYFLSVIGIIIAIAIATIIPATNTTNHGIAPTHATLMASFKQLKIAFTTLLKKSSLWLVGIVGCLLYLPISMFAELWSVPYLIRTYGFTNEQAAEIAAMIFLGMAIGSPIIGLISDHIKKRILPMFIGALLSCLTATTIIYLAKNSSITQLYILFFLLGLFTSGQTLVFAFARELTNVRIAGTAIAIVNMIVMIGGMLFQPLIGYLLVFISHGAKANQLTAYSAQDFYQVMIILPISIFLGLIIICFIKEPIKV